MKRVVGFVAVVGLLSGLSLSHSLWAKGPPDTAGQKVKVCHQGEDDEGNTVYTVIEVNPNGLNGHCKGNDGHLDYTAQDDATLGDVGSTCDDYDAAKNPKCEWTAP